MSSGQKVAFSFLISLFFIIGFVFVGQTGLMSKIETKYYAQSKLQEKTKELDELTICSNEYIQNILEKVQYADNSFLNNYAVKTFIQQNPSEKDEVARRNALTRLFSNLECIDGIRLIENNGRNIHYSSYDKDVLSKDGLSKQYKNFTDLLTDKNEIDITPFLIKDLNEKNHIYLDKEKNLIVITFPFKITEQTIFGTLVCYVNFYDYYQYLIQKNVIKVGEQLNIIAENKSASSGVIINLPGDAKDEFNESIINYWKKDTNKLEQIALGTKDSYLILSSKNHNYLNISCIYKNSDFQLSNELIYLIYISSFISVFLLLFLIFSLKRDYLSIIRSRIKKIQNGIINEYLDKKEEVEWQKVSEQIQLRKDELYQEIKKSVKNKKAKYTKKIDEYFEESWKEVVKVISENTKQPETNTQLNGASIEEIRRVIEEVLQNTTLNFRQDGTSVQRVTEYIQEKNVNNEVEDVEEIESLDDVEEIEEIQEIGEAEEIEEVEDIEEVQEVEELEQIDENQEVSEEIEEIQEADEIEPLEEISEAEDAEEITEEPQIIDNSQISDDQDAFSDVEEFDFEEELSIGNDNTLIQAKFNKEYNFIVEKPLFIKNSIFNDGQENMDSKKEIEDLQEIEELVPEKEMFYSMTSFGNNQIPVVELEGETPKSIVEDKGVYSIAKNLSYSEVKIDTKFKELVDSVLKE